MNAADDEAKVLIGVAGLAVLLGGSLLPAPEERGNFHHEGGMRMTTMPMPIRSFLACHAHLGAPLALFEKLARAVPPLRPAASLVNEGLQRYTDYRAQAFDRKHSTDTFSRIGMKKLGLEDELGDGFNNWAYGPICGDFFHEIVREIRHRGELTFFDVGSGKGLPLMLAGEHGFRRIVGIELSQALCETARTNFARYTASTGRQINAEVICSDFMKYELPNEPTTFFLNNPFPHYIARHAIRHIEESIVKHPRRVVIAYRRMQLPTLRQLEASPHLRLELTTPYWQIFSSR
jgi:hypothetical protein